MSPSEAADRQTRRPSTHITVVPNAGHDAHLDQPDRLHGAIKAFHP